MTESVEHRRLIVAGTGAAGLTAAIYAARSNNDPLVLEGDEPGGQLTLTSEVENFPGFPEGLSGPDLINNMKEQAERFGTELKHGIVADIDDSERPFRVELSNGDVYTCDAFIAASGASARTLGVPGEDELMATASRRVQPVTARSSAAKTCSLSAAATRPWRRPTSSRSSPTPSTSHTAARSSAPRTTGSTASSRRSTRRNRDHAKHRVAGDARLTRRRGRPRHPRTERRGHPSEKLDDDETETFDFDVGAVFIAIGHTPNTDYLEDTGVELDDTGYIQTHGGTGGDQTATDVDGIFGAGDVVDYHYQQAVTAAGMGCKAAIDADEYLESQAEAAAEAESEAAAEADD